MGRLSKADIVTRALEVVGATRLQARGELWADMILERLARSTRMADLAFTHTAAISDGTATVAYPTDYGFLLRDATYGHVGVLQDSAGTRSYLVLYGPEEVKVHVERTTASKGTPFAVADDPINSQWRLHPISNIAGSVILNYQRIPAPVLSNAVVWWPDDLGLVEAIASIAERHQRGGLVQVAKAIEEQAKAMVLRSPGQAQMWTNGGPGSGLDPRFFRKR